MFTALTPTDACFKNPAFSDHLIALSLKQKYKDFVSLSCLKDEFEELANRSMIKRIIGHFTS